MTYSSEDEVDITGYATEFITFGVVKSWHVNFASSIRELWPEALSAGVPVRSATVFCAPLTPLGSDGESEVIPFSRDAVMEAHWEERGYAPMPDGEGPFAVLYGVMGGLDSVIEMAGAPRGPRWNRRDVGSSDYNSLPYQGRIVSPLSIAITLITSTDPKNDQFSARIVELLASSLLGAEPEAARALD